MAPELWRADRALRFARALLACASWLVPRGERRAWRDEWEGELFMVRRRGARVFEIVRFACAGAQHALWERWEEGTMRGIGQDLRLATRRLSRAPVFTGVIVGVVALGIGVNASLFSALRGALLGGAPYPEPERLVAVDMLLRAGDEVEFDTLVWSYPKFEAARRSVSGLESLAGYSTRTATLTGAGDPTRISLEQVSAGYFDLLGVTPVLGRLPRADEEPPATADVVLLEHAMWSGRFGRDPAVLGRTLELNGASLTIIGVLPPGFRGLTGSTDAWIPMAAVPAVFGPRRLRAAWAHWIHGVGRLRPGVTLEQARQDAERVGVELTSAYPESDRGSIHGVGVVPFLAARVNPTSRLALVAVSMAAGLLLLVACANVASLVLVRASSRRSDLAVKVALGAGRGRLARETLVESVLLAGAGGLLAVVLAWAAEGVVGRAAANALDASGSRGLQFLRPEAMTVDGGVLAFALAATAAAALLFGIVPARAAAAADPVHELRAGGASSVGRRRGGLRGAFRSTLVVAQLALTVLLLAGAGLMLASYRGLTAVELGFQPRSVLAARYEMGPERSSDEVRSATFELVERMRGLPGVRSAAVTTTAPLSGSGEIVGLIEIDGRPSQGPVGLEAVTPGVFETLGMDIVEGPGFTPGLGPDDPPQAVVSRSAALRIAPDGSAVGRRIRLTHGLTSEQPAEVVGVVDDVPDRALEQAPMARVYVSQAQAPTPYGTILVAGTGVALDWLAPLRAQALEVDPELPLFDVVALADRVAAASARTRVVLGLFGAFGLLALLLSGMGLWGLVSFSVARRTREVGLRVALGSGWLDVVLGLVRRPLVLAGVGGGLGVLTAAWATRFLAALLFEVEPGDARVLAAASALLLAVAAASALAPALRALRIEPTEALRAE